MLGKKFDQLLTIAIIVRQGEPAPRASMVEAAIGPAVANDHGARIEVLAYLLKLVSAEQVDVCGIFPQEEANALFQRPVKSAEVRLTGQSAYTLDSSAVTVTPYQRRQLASPALGWLGGGQIAVNTEEKTGQRTLESFFEVQANLRPHTEAVPISGMTGWLRLAMPWRPLLAQIQLAFMQLLQKRYQL